MSPAARVAAGAARSRYSRRVNRSAQARFRRFPIDDALLLFDRDSGWNVLLEGEETRGLRMLAPRSVQFAITNRCNLACTFCSRDVRTASTWTGESAFVLLAELDQAGVLEVAFGGGEPFAFKGFVELVQRLHAETRLAVSATTNGLLLDAARLRALRGRYGQLRLSLYDDNDWRQRVELLAGEDARFGVNLLVTPARLASIEDLVLELAEAGCRDVLLLSYTGGDRSLHLAPHEASALAERVGRLARALAGQAELKLDVCWGERMSGVPQVLRRQDCGAGRDFVVVTSDRKVQPCSFHHDAVPFGSAAELLEIWRAQRTRLTAPARTPGCARLPAHGLPIVGG